MKQQPFLFFLAGRFILAKNNSYAIKVVTWVCFSAIMIGCMALTLIFAIMQGFESTTCERLQNIYPQVIIQAPINQDLNWLKIQSFLNQEPNILASSPYAISYGVLHNPKLSDQIDLHQISLIKAIDPSTDQLVSNLTTKINWQNQEPSLSQALVNQQILIGTGLAKNLGLEIASPAEIFIPCETNAKKQSMNFKKIKVTIGAIIKTGISEFDDSLIITSLDFAQKIFHDFGINEIGIKLKPGANQKQLVLHLKKQLNLNIVTWQELYAPIMSALKLEKYTGVAIAILIILIACMTLIALLFMLITKHTGNIAILTVLGLLNSQISQLFILISLLITSAACLIGMLLAGLLGLIIKNYEFIELPEAYVISSLPIKLCPEIFGFVFGCTLILALMATLIPINLIHKLNLSQLLKAND